MKMRQYYSARKVISAYTIAMLGSFIWPTGASAQDEPESMPEILASDTSEGIVVVAAAAKKVQPDARPIVTALMPSLPPETPEERLDRVAYFLRAASAGRCAQPEMLTGLALHEMGAYDLEQRELVERTYQFGRGVGIRHLIPQGAAARSGFLAGDVITRVNDRDIAEFETGLIKHRASYDRTERFETYLNTTLAAGPAQVTIRRGKMVHTLTLLAQPGCGGKPVLYSKGGLNAWSDGKYIALTNTMMKFASDDSELAFVVSHEMAHNLLEHARKLRGKLMLLASLGIGSGKIKNSEIEADQLGAEILVSAGYDVEGALSLLTRAGGKIPIYLAITHPGIKRRISIVTEAAARFEQTSLQARADREGPGLAAGLTDLAFIARSVRIPEVALSLPPLQALADLGGGKGKEDDSQSDGREVAMAPLSEPVASVSLTSTQESNLAKALGTLRTKTI